MKQATRTVNGATQFTQINEYNGEGQRIRKTEGSDVTNYFYEGSSLLYTTDSSDALKGFILYDANGSLLKQIQSSDTAYTYTFDIQGSIVNLVDSSANSVVSYTYTDFGETAEGHGSSVYNELRYTGGVYDETTGLYYLNARFYDPSTGRFLNPDSYRGEPVNPQTLHLYAYCANNPINLVDPTGYAAETVVDVVFLGISYAEFVAAPSVTTFIYLVWDGVATVTPFVPGSYVGKGAKVLSQTKVLDNIASVLIKDIDNTKIIRKGKTTYKTRSTKAGTGNHKRAVNGIKYVKNTFPTDSSTLKHIFRNAEGHIKDTPANRKLLERVANDSKDFLGKDQYGNEWYAEILDNGTQVWVSARNGKITNGGINSKPLKFNKQTGLKKQSRGW